MTYAVTWATAAALELIRLEAADSVPPRVRTAGEWIDYTLRRVPLDLGESREYDERVWYGDVLGVHFSVDTKALTVRVIAVAPSRRH